MIIPSDVQNPIRRNPLDLVKDSGGMDSCLLSIIVIFILGMFATNQLAFAENTWHVGEGLKDGDYFRYNLCQVDYKSCLPFKMGFWIKGKTDRGDWDMQVLVKDGNKIVRGYIQVGRISPEPINYSDNIGPYASAYKNSIVWLSGFTAVLDQKTYGGPNWNTMGTVEDFPVKRTIVNETIAVPAGIFEAYVIGWHKGIDNKIWIVDNFPFPVKALTFVDVNNPVKPIQYQFELLEYGNSSTKPKFLDYDPEHVVISPAKQIVNGVLLEDVVCKEGLQLIFKSKNDSPACVKPQTANKLLERGWNMMPHGWLSHIDIVGTVSYERFPTPGHFAFCESFTLIPDHVDKAKLGNITSSKITLFKNIRVGGGDEVYVEPPFDRLTEKIKEKKIHVVGELFREFETGCHNWYKDSSGTFTGEIEKETNPVLIPKEIEILGD